MNRIVSKREYLAAMDKYIEDFKKLSPERAKAEASKGLIAIGVLAKDGKPKDRICTESHLSYVANGKH